jgi:hypothetical protein
VERQSDKDRGFFSGLTQHLYLTFIKIWDELGMVMYIYNTSTWEAETKGTGVPGYLARLCLKPHTHTQTQTHRDELI